MEVHSAALQQGLRPLGMHKALLQRAGRGKSREEQRHSQKGDNTGATLWDSWWRWQVLMTLSASACGTLSPTFRPAPICPNRMLTYGRSLKVPFFPFAAEIYLICFEQEQTQIPGPLNKGELWRGNTMNVLILCHPFFETLCYIKLILQMKAKS